MLAGSNICLCSTVEQHLNLLGIIMVLRISGKYKENTVSHLKYNYSDITDVTDICNTLAERFAFNSSSDNNIHKFNR